MPKIVYSTKPPTQRQIRASIPFDLRLRSGSDRPIPTCPDQIARTLTPGRITYLTGPSGSGKTSAIHALCKALQSAGHRVELARPAGRGSTRLIDAFSPRLPLSNVMRLLSTFGLAEPALVARTLSELSQGQRHRAELAIAFHRATSTGVHTLLFDEFASLLDRVTARSLSSTLARAVRHVPIRVVCATAHDDLAPDLEAAALIRFNLDGSIQFVSPGVRAQRDTRFTLEPGTLADLDRLLPYHYRAGRPATCVRILRAVDRASGSHAGVLAVSMPTLNGGWRNLAWPGRYAGPDRRAHTRRINAELRCISRVIIDPRFRGLGLARRLVEHYLADPLTPATEAIAAMGEFCPFFERAGMTAYSLTLSPADARLDDALHDAAAEPWMLADPERAQDIIGNRLIARELGRWVRDRKIAATCPIECAALAASRLCARPVAYAHVFPPRSASRPEAARGDHERQSRPATTQAAAGAR